VYSLTDGLMRDLAMNVEGPGETSQAFDSALAAGAITPASMSNGAQENKSLRTQK
jgi:hypothetical protein